MIELAYTSTASWLYSAADLTAILDVSRKHNAVHGITGLLLYKSGSVMQLLEGEAEPVRALYARLLLDSRHHDLTKLYERPLTQRRFPLWSMGFESLDGQHPVAPDLHRISSKGQLIPQADAGPQVQRLLNTFLTNLR